MQWTQINVHTSPEAEEAVVHILLDMGAQGVAVGTDGRDPVVTAYVAEAGPDAAEAVRRRVQALAQFGLDPGAALVTVAAVDDEDWAESWKRHYRPLSIGRSLLVKPAWMDVNPAGRFVIELDPGMAFGTGYHPTTALCLEALEDVIRPGHVVVDVGTGSGILGIAAARLGASVVVGVDTEIEAVEAAAENVRRNGVENVMTVGRGSTGAARNLLAARLGTAAGTGTKAARGAGARSGAASAGVGKAAEPSTGAVAPGETPGEEAAPVEKPAGVAGADVVAVNILARVIDRLAEELFELLKPGGVMVAGGIIDHAADALTERLRSVGFVIEDERRRDEWCCLIARRVD